MRMRLLDKMLVAGMLLVVQLALTGVFMLGFMCALPQRVVKAGLINVDEDTPTPTNTPICGGTPVPTGMGCCESKDQTPVYMLYWEWSSCCSPLGRVVPKSDWEDISDCPNRATRPGWTGYGCLAQAIADPEKRNCCTGVQDLYFTFACHFHDDCYADCHKTKEQCDDEFITDMLQTCGSDGLFAPTTEDERMDCVMWASRYAHVQYLPLWETWVEAQQDGCMCCP